MYKLAIISAALILNVSAAIADAPKCIIVWTGEGRSLDTVCTEVIYPTFPVFVDGTNVTND